MSDEEQVFECSRKQQWIAWVLVVLLAGPMTYMAVQPWELVFGPGRWLHCAAAIGPLATLVFLWLRARQPRPVRVVVNDNGLMVQWEETTTGLLWEQVLEGRLVLHWRGAVMRFLLAGGGELRVPLEPLGRQFVRFRELVASYVGGRTQRRIEAELQAGAPVSAPHSRVGGAALAYVVGSPVVWLVAMVIRHPEAWRCWPQFPAGTRAAMLGLMGVDLLGYALAIPYAVRLHYREYRFTSTAFEERWPGGRRELAYADIERVVVRRRRKRFLAERMAIIGPRRKFRLDQTMARYEAVLGLLRKLAPQAVVIEEER